MVAPHGSHLHPLHAPYMLLRTPYTPPMCPLHPLCTPMCPLHAPYVPPTCPYAPPMCPLHAPYVPPMHPLNAPYMPLWAPYVPPTCPYVPPMHPNMPPTCPLCTSSWFLTWLRFSNVPTTANQMVRIDQAHYNKILIFFPTTSLKCLRAARIDELADSNEPAMICHSCIRSGESRIPWNFHYKDTQFAWRPTFLAKKMQV